MDLSLRPSGSRFAVEKLYIDALLPDGGVLIVSLGRLKLYGITMARVTANFYLANGEHRHGHAKAWRILGLEDELRFGPARIKNNLLTWKSKGLSGELEFRPRFAPFTLLDPVLEDGPKSVRWGVEIPDADVSGVVYWPGGKLDIQGRGYRDRTFLDIPPRNLPFSELHWGRGVAGDHAVIWLAGIAPGHHLAASWEDGVVLANRIRQPELFDVRVLADTEAADRPGLRLGLMRPVLRRVIGHLHEVQLAAATNLGGDPGRAVFSRVRWS